MKKFRMLKANEIECRVQSVSTKGVILLLYKDARADMNILDETVGAENWQKTYSRDNANCTVSIWDDEKKQWISKEDTGKESNMEKEKGLASDSFKRASVCWGIGRELYTSPLIWIPADKCQIKESGQRDNNGKPKMACYDRFAVEEIGYNDDGVINHLKIYNKNIRQTVFEYTDSREGA